MISIAIVSVTSGSPLKADKLELPGMKLKISKPALQNAGDGDEHRDPCAEPAIERHEASHEQKRAERFHRKRKRNHDAQQRDDIQIAAAGAFAGEYKVANADAAADEQRETRCKRGTARPPH